MKSRLLLLAALAVTACTANPATGGYNFSLVSAEEERAIGEATAKGPLLADGLYRPASPATHYVTSLCNTIFATTEMAASPLQCNLIDTDVFNASATPGYMFINRGLLPFVSSEAELASVLGHESGHHTARHANRSLTKDFLASTLAQTTLATVAYQTDDYGTLQLVANGANLTKTTVLSAYNRAEETEADMLGRRYLEKAGYDPRASVSMQRQSALVQEYQASQRIAFNNGKIAPVSLLEKLESSHPATQERIAAALAATGEPVALPPEQDLGRQRYMAAIQGLAYGPARRYGIARKSSLVLPQQRVIIPLPADTTTAYIGSGRADALGTWLIAHPTSGAYFTVTSLKKLAGSSPATQLQALLPLLHQSPMRIEIGTAPVLPLTAAETTPEAESDSQSAEDAAIDAAYVAPTSTGYTATYRYLNTDKRYRMLAVSAPATVDEMLIFTIIYPNQEVLEREDANLLAILKNITFLTKRQAKKVKPLEIFTFTAAAGQTVAQQAAHLPVGALQEDLFRALNNLPAGTEMQPGQIYKTILDPNP